jgi:uncharacterized lipoprotein YmbA
MKAPIAILLTGLAVAGCAGQPQTSSRTYDFGVAQAAQQAGGSVQVQDIRAPVWLDSSDMFYRLAYQDPRMVTRFGDSSWAGAPASMLTLRLRQELGNVPGAPCTLSSSLMEFSQVFDSRTSSRAVLHLQATLSAGTPARRLQQDFRLEAATPTPDAPGGAAAFSGLAEQLARDLGQWIAQSGLCAQS